MAQLTAVFGAVTLSDALEIVNATLLVAVTGPLSQVTRTSAVVVAGPVTVHDCTPVVAVTVPTGGAIVVHVPPLSRLTSTLNCAVIPRLCVHLMVCVLPTGHDTAVFGALTVIAPLPLAIVKFASETPLTLLLA